MSSSSWKMTPKNTCWNTPNNWVSGSIPTDCASFATSAETVISFTADSQATLDKLEFNPAASSFTFLIGTCQAPALTLLGEGISNLANVQQTFKIAATTVGYQQPQLKFSNQANAGNADMYYCTGPESEQGYGGGVIRFADQSCAGQAAFKVWTGAGIPPKHSTVGAEVSFGDSANAGSAKFSIYGSLGTDGDTFGNVVFHDQSSAAKASFTNVGGTVSGGDGGNTQFYETATAANGVYNNYGGTHAQANGGDVAFDSTATGGNGLFYNYAAPAAGAYGGVTSFNNNPPHTSPSGASAGQGCYHNFGARPGEKGGGGHMEFSAKYGSPTAEQATIINYGSCIESRSSAGHTLFSINLPSQYYPTAANATIWNHPALTAEGAAGFTEFAIWGTGTTTSKSPTAGKATLINLGGYVKGAAGGYTEFSASTTAGQATLIAYGGSNDGYGGKIAFYDDSTADNATIKLLDGGELNIAKNNGVVKVQNLYVSNSIISTTLGKTTPLLDIVGTLGSDSQAVYFEFTADEKTGFQINTPYTVLSAANLNELDIQVFSGSVVDGIAPSFKKSGNSLQVSFIKH